MASRIIMYCTLMFLATTVMGVSEFERTCRRDMDLHFQQYIESEVSAAEDALLGGFIHRLEREVQSFIDRHFNVGSGIMENILNLEAERQALGYQRKIESLQKHRRGIAKKVADIKLSFDSLQDELDRALSERKPLEKVDVTGYDSRLAEIRKRCQMQLGVAYQLKSDVRSIQLNDTVVQEIKEETNRSLEAILGVFSIDNSSLELLSDVNDVEKEVLALKSSLNLPSVPVRFHARLTDVVFLKISSGSSLTFDTVLQNNGRGYNEKTGVFTAPVKGRYCYWAFLIGLPETPLLPHVLSVAIELNGKTLHSLGKDGNGVEGLHTLERGDRVWIEKRQSVNIGNIGAPMLEFGLAFIDETK